MKIEFIKRGAATRLILIFAGWSTDSRFYSDCVAEGWDTAVVTGFLDPEPPCIPDRYSTVYLFAYSLGVWAAERCRIQAAVRVAICGTPLPVSDTFGIPKGIFRATADNLTERSLFKFHCRMAGGRSLMQAMEARLPHDSDIETLRSELYHIAEHSCGDDVRDYAWSRAYVAGRDAIIPAENQIRYWESRNLTPAVMADEAHNVDIASIVRQCVPDHDAIERGFSKAEASYNSNAFVQAEICDRMAKVMRDVYGDAPKRISSLLEIGAGRGMLTERWSGVVEADRACYLDLCAMPAFGKAEKEEYVVADAEEWLERSDRKFDLIVSASTIQWFADPVRFVRSLKRSLAPGGVAVVSTFSEGNLCELDSLRVSPIIYHNAEDYISDDVSHWEKWERTVTFDTARDMLMHLRLTGVSPSGGNASNRVLPLSRLPRQLTYKPLILVVRN